MKVIDDSEEASQERLEALIITGNGRSEYRRLRPLCEHYDDEKELLLPSGTERHINIIGTTTHPDTERRGWDSLDAIQLYKSKYKYYNYLYIIDKEHCDEYGQQELEQTISEIATGDDIETRRLRDGAYVSHFNIGSKEITLYTAVVGDEFGFFEDCLADLLELEWGNTIDGETKDDFKSSVNRAVSGGAGQTLLSEADRRNLEEAFPSLSAILSQFERRS